MQVGSVQLGLIDVVIMAFGLACFGVGVWLLVFVRPPRRPRGAELIVFPEPPPAKVSEPTRLSLAVIGLITGYHLFVWGLPRAMVGVQLNRDYWYVWILIALAGIGLTVMLDRLDQRYADSNKDGGNGPA